MRSQSPFRKPWIAGGIVVALTVGVVATFGAPSCGDDEHAADNKPVPPAGPVVTLQGRIPLPAFPTDKKFVAVSGNPAEAVPEGAVGLLVKGPHTYGLAMLVAGNPVEIPDSDNALFIQGVALPGSDSKLLAFAKTTITPAETFGKVTLFDVDKTGWSLEYRVLSPAGKVLKSASLKHPEGALQPVAIDVNTKPISALVQVDRSGIAGRGVMTSDPASTETSFILVDIDPNSPELVKERSNEPALRSQFKALMVAMTPPQQTPAACCGKFSSAGGVIQDCGECDQVEEPEAGTPLKVCVKNHCVLGGSCTPKTRAEVCEQGACGPRSDGCANVVDCGTCAAGLECEPTDGKVGTFCIDPKIATPESVTKILGKDACGTFVVEPNSQKVTVNCPDGKACNAGQCAK